MKPIIIDYNYYCPFCGNKIESSIDYDTRMTYYECSCDDAKQEMEILKKIDQLSSSLPKAKYCSETITWIKKIS